MITIPEQHYCTFRSQGDDDLNLGFLVPDGTDKAAEKRKSTADMWAVSRYHRQTTPSIESQTFKNELMSGFKIARSVRRYGWNGGNVVWRIEDPRGFELEISSNNFASIVDCTTIINGEIQGKCIWGRDGAINVLLPGNSQPYVDAIRDTKIKNSKTLSQSSLKTGDIIRLNNGDIKLYLGKMYCVPWIIQHLSVETTSSHTYHYFTRRCETPFGLAASLGMSQDSRHHVIGMDVDWCQSLLKQTVVKHATQNAKADESDDSVICDEFKSRISNAIEIISRGNATEHEIATINDRSFRNSNFLMFDNAPIESVSFAFENINDDFNFHEWAKTQGNKPVLFTASTPHEVDWGITVHSYSSTNNAAISLKKVSCSDNRVYVPIHRTHELINNQSVRINELDTLLGKFEAMRTRLRILKIYFNNKEFYYGY